MRIDKIVAKLCDKDRKMKSSENVHFHDRSITCDPHIPNKKH